MGVRVISNEDGAVLYCSTTMEAFGPVFDDEDEANEFLDWLCQDARTISPIELKDRYTEFVEKKVKEEQEKSARILDFLSRKV